MPIDPALLPFGINLQDAHLFEQNEAHESFRTLRRERLVPWHPGTERLNGFWSFTKYEDILYVSRHPELFISSKRIAGAGLRDTGDYVPPRPGDGGVSLITIAPPRHVKMRRLVNKGFTPRVVNAMEPQIRAVTNEILDRVAARDGCDFVLEIARTTPARCHLRDDGPPAGRLAADVRTHQQRPRRRRPRVPG